MSFFLKASSPIGNNVFETHNFLSFNMKVIFIARMYYREVLFPASQKNVKMSSCHIEVNLSELKQRHTAHVAMELIKESSAVTLNQNQLQSDCTSKTRGTRALCFNPSSHRKIHVKCVTFLGQPSDINSALICSQYISIIDMES